MSDRLFNVLFLCTGNSARSIIAEGILRKLGEGKFRAFSAGSRPKGFVNPFALKVLAAHQCPTRDLRSKSWVEYSRAGAATMDFVFTVCDSAAGEACPLWPGRPITAHWGIEDPAAIEGTDLDKERAFEQAYTFMLRRIQVFISLPIASLDDLKLQAESHAIGGMDGATSKITER